MNVQMDTSLTHTHTHTHTHFNIRLFTLRSCSLDFLSTYSQSPVANRRSPFATPVHVTHCNIQTYAQTPHSISCLSINSHCFSQNIINLFNGEKLFSLRQNFVYCKQSSSSPSVVKSLTLGSWSLASTGL